MAGLLVWIPILATVLVVRFILDLMDQTLLLLPPGLRPQALFGVHIPGLGALLAIVLLLLTGLLVTNIIGRSLVRLWDDLLNRIPFVRAHLRRGEELLDHDPVELRQLVQEGAADRIPAQGHLEHRLSDRGGRAARERRASVEPHVCVFIPTTPESDLRLHRDGAALAGDRAEDERR